MYFSGRDSPQYPLFKRALIRIYDYTPFPETFVELKQTVDNPKIRKSFSVPNNPITSNDTILPKIFRNRDDKHFIGAFLRALNDGSNACYQILLVWDVQMFPPHPMDYTPVFVYDPFASRRYIDGDESGYTTIWDKEHYFVGREEFVSPWALNLEVVWPWHSIQIIDAGTNFDAYLERRNLVPVVYKYLSDELINHWWSFIKEKPRLKIKSVLKCASGQKMIGRDYFPDKKPRFRDRLALEIARPLLGALRRTRNLESFVEEEMGNLINQAKIQLGNPGYRRVVASCIAFVSLLEECDYLVSGYLMPVFNKEKSIGKFIRKFRDLIDEWKPKVEVITEAGHNYYNHLVESYYKEDETPSFESWLQEVSDKRKLVREKAVRTTSEQQDRVHLIQRLLWVILMVYSIFASFIPQMLPFLLPIIVGSMWPMLRERQLSMWRRMYEYGDISLEEWMENLGFEEFNLDLDEYDFYRSI